MTSTEMTGNAIQEFVNDPNAKKGIAIGIAEMCQVQTQSQLEPAREFGRDDFSPSVSKYIEIEEICLNGSLKQL